MKLTATVTDLDIVATCSKDHFIRWDKSDLRRTQPLTITCTCGESAKLPDDVVKSLVSMAQKVYEVKL